MGLKGWARKSSIHFFMAPQTCCADEFFQLEGARYDLERMGIYRAAVPEEADVLVVPGWVNSALSPVLEGLHDRIPAPKRVMAVGVCACGSGPWGSESQWRRSIDVLVPGCPPRPEAIMEGFIKLRELAEKEG